MEHEKVLRINELAKIKKERSLTPEEDAERKASIRSISQASARTWKPCFKMCGSSSPTVA